MWRTLRCSRMFIRLPFRSLSSQQHRPLPFLSHRGVSLEPLHCSSCPPTCSLLEWASRPERGYKAVSTQKCHRVNFRRAWEPNTGGVGEEPIRRVRTERVRGLRGLENGGGGMGLGWEGTPPEAGNPPSAGHPLLMTTSPDGTLPRDCAVKQASRLLCHMPPRPGLPSLGKALHEFIVWCLASLTFPF